MIIIPLRFTLNKITKEEYFKIKEKLKEEYKTELFLK